MKYMAIIDADEKPVSCEFIGCNGNVAPYLIGATTNIKPLEQEPVLDKIRAEIEELDRYYDNDYFSTNNCPMYKCNEVLLIIDKYKAESENL